jgi:hypothetical protein
MMVYRKSSQAAKLRKEDTHKKAAEEISGLIIHF